jgi:hypothetical protein
VLGALELQRCHLRGYTRGAPQAGRAWWPWPLYLSVKISSDDSAVMLFGVENSPYHK